MITVVDARRATLVALAEVTTEFGWKDTQLAGSPPPSLSGLALLPSGRLVVVDQGRHCLVVVDPDGGNPVVLDPSAAVGALHLATGVATGYDGAILVADKGNGRIVRASDESGSSWSAFGVRGGGAPGTFAGPVAVAVDASGRLVVADPRAGHLVRIDDMTGAGWTEIALPGQVTAPYGVSRDGDGLLVTDLSTRAVLRVAVDDSVSLLIDGSVLDAGRAALVAPIAATRHGDTIVVADAGTAQLTSWADDGGGTWTRKERLAGTPRALPGPEFTRLTGLVAS
jgi:streptogramin lyase